LVLGDQAAPEEPEAKGDADPETVQGHLQDPDPAVQGSQGSGLYETHDATVEKLYFRRHSFVRRIILLHWGLYYKTYYGRKLRIFILS
jgi:hypothetical protein